MEYECSLDERSRLIFPRELRKKIGEIAIVYRSSKCLFVYSQKRWQELEEKFLTGLPREWERKVERYLFSRSIEENFDGRRILLAGFLRNGLIPGVDVILVDSGDHLEIWDKARYMAKPLGVLF